MEELDRYSRQTIFAGIGPEGQRKLAAGFAVVVGCGALGTVISSALVRAGVGRVRVIDRDFIEYHNLQRQVLFTERDIEENLPKATAAERHLREANSAVQVEGVVADFSRTNAEKSGGGRGCHRRRARQLRGPFPHQRCGSEARDPLGVRGSDRVLGHDGHLPARRAALLPVYRELSSGRWHAHLRYGRGGERRPLDRRVIGGGRGPQDPDRRRTTSPGEPRPGGDRRVDALLRITSLGPICQRGVPCLWRDLRIPPGPASHPGHESLRAERGPDLERGRGGHAAGPDRGAPGCSRTGGRQRADGALLGGRAGAGDLLRRPHHRAEAPGTRSWPGRYTRSTWGCKGSLLVTEPDPDSSPAPPSPVSPGTPGTAPPATSGRRRWRPPPGSRNPRRPG